MRLELLKHFFRLKYMIRKHIAGYKKYSDSWSKCRRAIEIIKARNSPFDASRLEKLEAEKAALRDQCREYDRLFMDMNPALIQLCTLADIHLSEHDQAQVLGLNHIAFRKWRKTFRESLKSVLNEDRHPRLYECIFHHAEWKEREVDFISQDMMLTMPFYMILHCDFVHQLHNNEDFNQAMKGIFDKFFPNAPKYEEIHYPDGTIVLERLPPELKLVKNP